MLKISKFYKNVAKIGQKILALCIKWKFWRNILRPRTFKSVDRSRSYKSLKYTNYKKYQYILKKFASSNIDINRICFIYDQFNRRTRHAGSMTVTLPTYSLPVLLVQFLQYNMTLIFPFHSFTTGFKFHNSISFHDFKLAETTYHFWTKRTSTVSSKKTCRPKPNFLDETNWDETYLGRNDLEPSFTVTPLY